MLDERLAKLAELPDARSAQAKLHELRARGDLLPLLLAPAHALGLDERASEGDGEAGAEVDADSGDEARADGAAAARAHALAAVLAERRPRGADGRVRATVERAARNCVMACWRRRTAAARALGG